MKTLEVYLITRGLRSIAIAILLSATVLLAGCGSATDGSAEGPANDGIGQNFKTAIDYIPYDIQISVACAKDAIAHMGYQPNDIYPAYEEAAVPNIWHSHPSNFHYKPDEYFGVNTLSRWYGGALFIQGPDHSSSYSFYDWGFLCNIGDSNDNILYTVRHNCYLDETYYWYIEGGDYYQVNIPTLDWDHILEPAPAGG